MKFLPSEHRDMMEVIASIAGNPKAVDFTKSKGWLTVKYEGRSFSFFRIDDSYLNEQFKMVKSLSYALKIENGEAETVGKWQEVLSRFGQWLSA